MATASINGGNLPPKQKRSMIMEILKGRETTIHLQTLLKKPREDGDNGGLQELSLQILNSFSKVLSQLTAQAESTQIHATVDCSRRKKKLPSPPGVKNRRGCYKRRRTSDSWIVESSTMEDGFAWRKYGQKVILESQFPRCYYRCTHKYDSSCKATKQVQMMMEKPILYQITYLNHHICTKTSTTMVYPNLSLHSSQSKNIINFQITEKDDTKSSKTINPVKLEEQIDDQSVEVPSDAISSTFPHEDLVGVEINPESTHHPGLEEMLSGLQSCESTSLQYGMEVDHFSDGVDNFFYLDYNDRMFDRYF